MSIVERLHHMLSKSGIGSEQKHSRQSSQNARANERDFHGRKWYQSPEGRKRKGGIANDAFAIVQKSRNSD